MKFAKPLIVGTCFTLTLRLHKILLKDAADAVENVGRQLPVSFAGEVDEVDEFFVFTVKMRMRIDEADLRVLCGQLTDDLGMDG
ncbi:MAG TPA: hypothetical protein VK731_04310, partial [Candidatus Cybelea sp.]|nr:hypothetical protein [Candidatus Cybelea sp.]